MFPIAFPFDHPAWEIAQDALGVSPARDLLAKLVQEWDDDVADNLFYDRLCHQERLFPASFLALPHVVALAETLSGRSLESLALFAGLVVLHAREQPRFGGHSLHESEEWWQSEPFQDVEAVFEKLLPEIGKVCLRAYRKTPYHVVAAGLAACCGHAELGAHLHSESGTYSCPSCKTRHEWELIAGKVAIYPPSPADMRRQNPVLEDYRDGSPIRASIVGLPVEPEHQDATHVRSLLGENVDLTSDALLRNFKCKVGCIVCAWQGPLPARQVLH